MLKKAKRKSSKKAKPSKKVVYLTTELLKRAIAKESEEDSTDGMTLVGYVVKEEKGRIIKVYPDGRIEELSKITTGKSSKTLALD
jgi:hypothetical protein